MVISRLPLKRVCPCFRVPVLLVLVLLSAEAHAFENSPCPGSTCSADAAAWFTEEVWPKVASLECVKCHKAGGDAEDSRFVLSDLSRVRGGERDELLRQNRDAFVRMTQLKSDGQSLLLVKVAGGLDHGGNQVLKPDSTGYRILKEFARRVMTPGNVPGGDTTPDQIAEPFFDGIVMLSDRQLLRRMTLSLAARLPSESEQAAVAAGGLEAVSEVLADVMREDAFYDRLREGFNDIFLTLGVDGNPDQTVLSYEHFDKTRGWYLKYDLSHIADKTERRNAGYTLAREYRAALLDEPMRLIEHIVRNDRPFTEIVTADYIMVSPYTARGYGIYDEVQGQFTNPDDPFEYLPVKLKALKGRRKSEDQQSETGFYPHAGLLSLFQYLSRYPTTETNRNRLRARMYYQHFLGVDVLELAARVSDAAAVSEKFSNPTMQAPECVVCHRTLDPVAGLFQNYWRFDRNQSLYGRRPEGWFTDMFAAGFEGEELPQEERWKSLQWLGKRTAEDSRFAATMVGHAYSLLTGRRPLLPPRDLDNPLYAAKRRAYQEQQRHIDAFAARFAASGFNFKEVIKDWVLSDFYRADGLAEAVRTPEQRAVLDDIGLVRMLSPEQLERKVEAVFGTRWGQLTGQTAMLYGGIDSKAVTERATDPSGGMGAIQRMLSNEVACRNVALDFSRPPHERILFPGIEPDVLPGSSAAADKRIRQTIVHLHQLLLGRQDEIQSREINRSFDLFAGIVADAARQRRFDQREIYYCRQGLRAPVPDPHYTVRAWRTVVTYLLRRHEFLYE